MERQSSEGFNLRRTAVRAAALVLLVVAFAGPWSISGDGVPPAEWCSEPLILLENERCVRLETGAMMLSYIGQIFIYPTREAITREFIEEMTLRELMGFVIVVLVTYLLLQPFLSTPLMVFGQERPRRRRYSTIAWGLAAAVSIFLLFVFCGDGLCSRLWGIWLYAALAVGMLAVEGFLFRPERT